MVGVAWIWWLLAPLVSTSAGATLLWWRARREIGWPGRRPDAMAAHRRLLAALPQPVPGEASPVTMRVLDPASDS